MIRSTMAAFAVFSLCLPSALSAQLQNRDGNGEQVTVRVAIDDLDLSRESGRAVLQRRVARAARQICGDRPSRELAQIVAHRRCYADVMASTQPRMDARFASASRTRAVAAR